MKNRESLYPGRVKLTPVDAANGIYDLIRADQPQEVGTPLNKKLLDFAVAACGVTAGTATAYTLDDEFGGFELVDGAKVNFRLHVASGANPTLNVNGIGAKRLLNVYGDAMDAGLAQGTWLVAFYNETLDAFVLVGRSVSDEQIAKWNAKVHLITAATFAQSTAASVTLPQGYRAFRMRGSIGASSAKNIYTDVNNTSYRGCASWINMANGTSGKNESYANVQDTIGASYACFDYWIEGSYIRGFVYSEHCIGTVQHSAGVINTVGVSFDVQSLGGTIILEGIA